MLLERIRGVVEEHGLLSTALDVISHAQHLEASAIKIFHSLFSRSQRAPTAHNHETDRLYEAIISVAEKRIGKIQLAELLRELAMRPEDSRSPLHETPRIPGQKRAAGVQGTRLLDRAGWAVSVI